MIAGAIILFTLLLTIFEKPHLLQRPVKIEKIIILSLLLATAIFSAYKENENDYQQNRLQKTADSLHIKLTDAQQDLDSIKNENRTARAESDLAHQQLEDSLSVNRREVKETAIETATRIIKNAGNNKEELRHKMDSIKEIQLPNLTPPTDPPYIDFKRVNNLLCIYLKIWNGTNNAAKNVSFKGFYLWSIDGKEFYETIEPFISIDGQEIAGRTTLSGTEYKGQYCIAAPFDSFSQHQFILIKGYYTNDNENSKVKKKMLFSFVWNDISKMWLINGNPGQLEQIHDSMRAAYKK